MAKLTPPTDTEERDLQDFIIDTITFTEGEQ